ncbi:class I SAM-dependent methyltransferase [Siminovitchia sp. FSL H7-0308]|uniref:SAM-dependent methyltransferase n=1 Tax=Siminovitchia thermophila TaxID=1245522 RepID=A0ABS2R4M2_9BACI|nr:class I SAM-dependent methyltransferase [Siminovitchia thermophila]MBM7714563.1 SAM-dependent methyltransferase [Siminovitchia thermophila]ONK22618.1 SAM-dependent methyltransferase [Bacillus sp. VT-16-64]
MGNMWNKRFATEEYVYGEEPNAFIREHVGQLRACGPVVCFAEGEGRNAVFLAREGHDVTAWDYAESGLRKTKSLAAKHGVVVKTKTVDLLEYEVEAGQFDAAIMVFGHFQSRDQKEVFKKMLKVVKPGGVVMLEVYSKEQIRYGTGGPREIDMLYDPKDVLDWIGGHHVVHFFWGEQDRKEGTLHKGLAHVIQLVLKKKRSDDE